MHCCPDWLKVLKPSRSVAVAHRLFNSIIISSPQSPLTSAAILESSSTLLLFEKNIDCWAQTEQACLLRNFLLTLYHSPIGRSKSRYPNIVQLPCARCIQGFPGTVEATVTYVLTQEGVLKARFEATTDKATPINMAQHTYWNLGGHDSGSILKHKLMING